MRLLVAVLVAGVWLLPAVGWAQTAADPGDDVLSGAGKAGVPKPADVPAGGDAGPSDTPDEKGGTDEVAPAPKPPPVAAPAPAAPSWEPHQVALLEALDKVDGQSSRLSVPVGSRQAYRNISIEVRSCFARPADQGVDAAAYLIIQDTSATTPNFVGWMLAAEPAASMMEHPVYDVRVLGCR